MGPMIEHTFKGLPFRMFTQDTSLWFVGIDVLYALGYSTKINTGSYYHKLTADQQAYAPCHLMSKTCGRPSKIISEEGVRVLIAKNRKGCTTDEFATFFNELVGHPESKKQLPTPITDEGPQCFNFGNSKIRVVEQNGEPWFMAGDVCRALGLRLYPSQYTQKLSADEKHVLYLSHVLNTRLTQLFDNKAPSVTLVSESGLYKLVMRTDKPEAKRFQDWVTRDVLPTIRKTGSYSKQTIDTPQTVSGLSDDAIILKAMEILQTRGKHLEEENTLLRQKAEAYDRVMELMGNAQAISAAF